MMFIQYYGDTGQLPTNKNHVVFKWCGKGNILFSITKKGNAASCHFSCDKKGLRGLTQVIDKFVKFVFSSFEWCRMVIAQILKPSVARLVEKLGFIRITGNESYQIYARLR